MKVLTLTQPWATLVAIGAKRIETRSWRTDYRGELAIHAAKGWKAEDQMLCGIDPFRSALERGGILRMAELPRGCIIAIVTLVACRPTSGVRITRPAISTEEAAFGDFSPGRWAWYFENVRAITPVAARGSLGLWDWSLR